GRGSPEVADDEERRCRLTAIERPTLGQLIGVAWLAWLFDRTLRCWGADAQGTFGGSLAYLEGFSSTEMAPLLSSFTLIGFLARAMPRLSCRHDEEAPAPPSLLASASTAAPSATVNIDPPTEEAPLDLALGRAPSAAPPRAVTSYQVDYTDVTL